MCTMAPKFSNMVALITANIAMIPAMLWGKMGNRFSIPDGLGRSCLFLLPHCSHIYYAGDPRRQHQISCEGLQPRPPTFYVCFSPAHRPYLVILRWVSHTRPCDCTLLPRTLRLRAILSPNEGFLLSWMAAISVCGLFTLRGLGPWWWCAGQCKGEIVLGRSKGL